jgi:hypothetical protein
MSLSSCGRVSETSISMGVPASSFPTSNSEIITSVSVERSILASSALIRSLGSRAIRAAFGPEARRSYSALMAGNRILLDDQAVDVFPAKQVIPTVFENIQPPVSGRNDGNVEGSPAEVKYQPSLVGTTGPRSVADCCGDRLLK